MFLGRDIPATGTSLGIERIIDVMTELNMLPDTKTISQVLVTIFNEENPIKFLEEIKPDIHIKGGDYNINQIIEKNVVEKNGGKIILIPEVKGYSTTDLIKKIIELYKD